MLIFKAARRVHDALLSRRVSGVLQLKKVPSDNLLRIEIIFLKTIFDVNFCFLVLEAHLWVCFSSMMSENAKSDFFLENSTFWGYLGHRCPRLIRKMMFFPFLKFLIFGRLRDPGI